MAHFRSGSLADALGVGRAFLGGIVFFGLAISSRCHASAGDLGLRFGDVDWCVLGIVMGRYPKIDRWLDPWLVVFLNLPALVLIVLCYLWIGLTETAAIAAVTLNKIPNVTTIIREGARALDPDLKAMSLVFKVPRGDYLRHFVIPQLAPFIAAAARSGIAVIWKIVLVVEFLGRSNGVGFQIHLYFQLFDVAMVLVYSLSFIAIMLAIEWMLLQPFERRARRWRDA